MQQIKATGRNAASLKYDLLAAMGAFALAEGKGAQRLVLRLVTLLTARYNWVRDELTVGQREIARLWSVDERTVKREMAKLRAMGWLVVKRQGVRGRVTEYRLDIEKVLRTTQPKWEAIGPDYEARLARGGRAEPPPENVVPLPIGQGRGGDGPTPVPDDKSASAWTLTQSLLHSEDPALFNAWFRALRQLRHDGGRVVLSAPSRFHADYVNTHFRPRLLYALQSMDEGIDEIEISH